MGVGPNYVLDKGLLATGSTAYAQGEIGVVTVGSGTMSSVANSVARATTAGEDTLMVVIQEDLDTDRLGTGKAFIDCRLLGIARVLTGGAVAALDRVTNDATARAVTAGQAAAGAQPANVLGIALTTATAAGQFIDVLLTPGASF